MVRNVIRHKLIRYLDSKAGQRVYADSIAVDLNEPVERVRAGINNLQRELGYPIDTFSTGVYDVRAGGLPPKGRPHRSDRIFQEVGTTKDGGLVIESEDGKLYRATEL